MTQSNQRSKYIIGGLSVFLFVIAVISNFFGAWNGIWGMLGNTFTTSCQINASEISISKAVIRNNESVKVSVRVANPKGHPVLFNWRAVYGTMDPGIGSSSSESTYTAPSEAVNETISVDITTGKCKPIKRSEEIVVIQRSTDESSNPNPTSTPTISDDTSPTDTPIPSNMPTPTATDTPIPPTPTATFTRTPYPPTSTNTPVPATATHTPQPTNTSITFSTQTSTPTKTSPPTFDVPAPVLVKYDGEVFIWEWDESNIDNDNSSDWYFDIKI